MNNVVVNQSVSSLVLDDGQQPSIAVSSTSTSLITVIDTGPQGPPGEAVSGALVVDQNAKVNGSVVYYDATSSQFKADANWTTNTLTDGGNFQSCLIL